jgi:hypothetical protein
MMTLAPLVARLLRKAKLGVDLRSASTKSWTIAPAEDRREPAAIFDPGDLARVTGLGDDCTMDKDLARIHERNQHHGATRAYLLSDVTLVGGHLFSGRWMQELGNAPLRWVGERRTIIRERVALAATRYGVRYFGHWLLDDLPLALAARELGVPVAPKRNIRLQHQRYSELAGIVVNELEATTFRELVVLEDVGQNADKRRRYQTLREKFGALSAAEHPGVMLVRGSSGVKRVLTNEDAVQALARARGFAVLHPPEHSAEELLAACWGARIVLGVEGSHMVHGLLAMKDGGTVCALMPPFRFNTILKDWSDAIGLRYAFMVGEAHGDGFRVDLRRLTALLDRISD